jgi:hypothetical protein
MAATSKLGGTTMNQYTQNATVAGFWVQSDLFNRQGMSTDEYRRNLTVLINTALPEQLDHFAKVCVKRLATD